MLWVWLSSQNYFYWSIKYNGICQDYFIQESKKALAIKHQIDTADKEIDQMVYVLYGLTEEEIEIVENNWKLKDMWQISLILLLFLW